MCFATLISGIIKMHSNLVIKIITSGGRVSKFRRSVIYHSLATGPPDRHSQSVSPSSLCSVSPCSCLVTIRMTAENRFRRRLFRQCFWRFQCFCQSSVCQRNWSSSVTDWRTFRRYWLTAHLWLQHIKIHQYALNKPILELYSLNIF